MNLARLGEHWRELCKHMHLVWHMTQVGLPEAHELGEARGTLVGLMKTHALGVAHDTGGTAGINRNWRGSGEHWRD